MENLIREYFFKDGSRGNLFWRCFFEEYSREKLHPGYFFEGESRENHFWRCFFEGESRGNPF